MQTTNADKFNFHAKSVGCPSFLLQIVLQREPNVMRMHKITSWWAGYAKSSRYSFEKLLFRSKRAERQMVRNLALAPKHNVVWRTEASGVFPPSTCNGFIVFKNYSTWITKEYSHIHSPHLRRKNGGWMWCEHTTHVCT